MARFAQVVVAALGRAVRAWFAGLVGLLRLPRLLRPARLSALKQALRLLAAELRTPGALHEVVATPENVPEDGPSVVTTISAFGDVINRIQGGRLPPREILERHWEKVERAATPLRMLIDCLETLRGFVVILGFLPGLALVHRDLLGLGRITEEPGSWPVSVAYLATSSLASSLAFQLLLWLATRKLRGELAKVGRPA